MKCDPEVMGRLSMTYLKNFENPMILIVEIAGQGH